MRSSLDNLFDSTTPRVVLFFDQFELVLNQHNRNDIKIEENDECSCSHMARGTNQGFTALLITSDNDAARGILSWNGRDKFRSVLPLTNRTVLQPFVWSAREVQQLVNRYVKVAGQDCIE